MHKYNSDLSTLDTNTVSTQTLGPHLPTIHAELVSANTFETVKHIAEQPGLMDNLESVLRTVSRNGSAMSFPISFVYN